MMYISKYFPKILIILSFSVLIVISYLMFDGFTKFKLYEIKIENSLNLINQIKSIQEYMVDIETAKRGYVLSNDEKFLEPYLGAYQKIESKFKNLKTLIKNSGTDFISVDSLRNVVDKQFLLMENIINLNKEGKHYEAKQIISSGIGKKGMDGIRELIYNFTDNIEIYKNNQLNKTQEEAKKTLVAIILGIIIFIVSFLIGFYLYLKQSKKRKLADEKIIELNKESEILNQKFNIALNAANIGVWEYDINRDKIYWDDRVFKLFEVNKENFNNTYEEWKNLVHHDDKDRIVNKLQKVINGENDLDDKYRIITKTGVIKYLKVNCVLIKNAEGKPDRLLGVNYDITLLEEANELLNKYNLELEKEVDSKISEIKNILTLNNSILESVSVGIYGLDLEGNSTFVNQEAADLLGYTKEELLGKMMHTNHHHHREDGTIYPREECPIFAAFSDGIIHTVTDEVFWKKDGTPFPVEYTSTPIYKDGKLNGAVVVFKDITDRKKAEEELAKSYSLLDATINSTEEGILVVDIAGNIQSFNNMFAKMWKIPEDILESKEDKKAINYVLKSIKEPEKFLKKVKHLYDNPAETSYDEIKLNDGRIFDRYSTPQKLDNKIVGRVWSFRDITEIRKTDKIIRENEKRLKNYIESIPDLFLVVNNKGKILQLNNEIEKVTGYSIEELIGQNISKLLPDRIKKEHDILLKNYFKKPSIRMMGKGLDINLKKKSGEDIPVDVKLSYYKYEDEVIAICLIRDITERKKAELELIKAKEKAEESEKVKDKFFANMSHELRTPLVGILGFSEIIKNEEQNSELREYGEMLYSSAFRLQRTLNTILDFSKIQENFKLEKDEIVIDDFVEEEFNIFKLEAKEKQLDYRLKLGCSNKKIISDKRLLGTICSHLLDNALKYTNEGFIELQTKIKKEGNTEFLLIEVNDSGKGIDSKHLKLIWEEFRQVSEGLARKYEGVGLGLSIVKKFVGLLKSKIEVKSVLGQGSVFCVKIPISFNTVESKKDTDVSIWKSTNKSIPETVPNEMEKAILVVEDEILNAKAIKRFLNKNYKVEHASNPSEAIKMCEEKIYDLVLMDINLKSDIDGIELMNLLKRQYKNYKTKPFVAQTAYAMITDRTRIMNSGFNDFIAKPYTQKSLLEIVDKNLKMKVA